MKTFHPFDVRVSEKVPFDEICNNPCYAARLLLLFSPSPSPSSFLPSLFSTLPLPSPLLPLLLHPPLPLVLLVLMHLRKTKCSLNAWHSVDTTSEERKDTDTINAFTSCWFDSSNSRVHPCKDLSLFLSLSLLLASHLSLSSLFFSSLAFFSFFFFLPSQSSLVN